MILLFAWIEAVVHACKVYIMRACILSIIRRVQVSDFHNWALDQVNPNGHAERVGGTWKLHQTACKNRIMIEEQFLHLTARSAQHARGRAHMHARAHIHRNTQACTAACTPTQHAPTTWPGSPLRLPVIDCAPPLLATISVRHVCTLVIQRPCIIFTNLWCMHYTILMVYACIFTILHASIRIIIKTCCM